MNAQKVLSDTNKKQKRLKRLKQKAYMMLNK